MKTKSTSPKLLCKNKSKPYLSLACLKILLVGFLIFGAMFETNLYGQCPASFTCSSGDGIGTGNILTLIFEAGNNSDDTNAANFFKSTNSILVVDGVIYNQTAQVTGTLTYTSSNFLDSCPSDLTIATVIIAQNFQEMVVTL